MLSLITANLPLVVLGAVSALVIFYLYRELQKAKSALAGKQEECTDALCKDRKRVRFADQESKKTKQIDGGDARKEVDPPRQDAEAPTPRAPALKPAKINETQKVSQS